MAVVQILALVAIMSVPISILAGAVVYVVRLARKGPEATLDGAVKRRELA